jgi:murein DD-endopeptidase MepM/ murein hydrolase activator NlpD
MLALMAGCSADDTRFGFLGDEQAPEKLAYSPPGSGYQTGSPGSGKGVKETSLAPLDKSEKLAKAPPAPERLPLSGPPYVKTAGAKTTYGPSPWDWANGPPPKWSGKPLWTDEEPFPWPDGLKDKAPHPKPSFQGHYTTRRGDTLAGIAERYKVSLVELKRVNGLSEEGQVKVGTVLAIPARGTASTSPPTAPPRVVQVKPVTLAPAPKVASLAPPEPAPKTAVKQSGAASDAKAPLKAPLETKGENSDAKFRWPVVGKVIGTFGSQPDGTKNEGIKLSVPIGTEIHAAESGRVHYAGDGLKGYGNLILLRHPNGWVSTYAHADKALVKAGDEVKRGQVIGKAGMSGPVAQPQLRFELRKGSQPVDPLPLLAN